MLYIKYIQTIKNICNYKLITILYILNVIYINNNSIYSMLYIKKYTNYKKYMQL